MYTTQTFQTSIKLILEDVLKQPVHKKVSFPLNSLDKRELQKFKSILADRAGQRADYRIPLNDGRGLHIQEYINCYKVHWDHADMATDPLGHLLKDAPHHIVTILGVVLLLLLTWFVFKK